MTVRIQTFSSENLPIRLLTFSFFLRPSLASSSIDSELTSEALAAGMCKSVTREVEVVGSKLRSTARRFSPAIQREYVSKPVAAEPP